MEVQQYVNATRAAERAARTFTVPADELRAWTTLSGPNPASAFGGLAQVDRGTAAGTRDYKRIRTAGVYITTLHHQPGLEKASTWTYNHAPGPAREPLDLHTEEALNWPADPTVNQPILGDVIAVNLLSFRGTPGPDVRRVYGRLADTGAVLIMSPIETAGLTWTVLAGWFRGRRYMSALDDGCVFRPMVPGVDQ